MQELTLVEADTGNEVMVHVDLDKGKVTTAYCWADGIPFSGERDCRTTKMTNRLFLRLHLGDLKRVPMWYALDEDEEHYDEQLEDIITKALTKFSNLIKLI